MAQNAKRPSRLSHRRLLLIAPILAVAIIGLIVYAMVSGTETVAVNTYSYLSIAIVNQSSQVRYIVPDKPIGIPGGYMATNKYLSDGVRGNYPLFSSPSLCGNVTGTGDLCLIRILSKVARSYTLGDFFDVWGVPLGPSETLSPSYVTNSTYLWEMCISASGSNYVPNSDWGNHVLVTGESVLLVYSPLGCG